MTNPHDVTFPVIHRATARLTGDDPDREALSRGLQASPCRAHNTETHLPCRVDLHDEPCISKVTSANSLIQTAHDPYMKHDQSPIVQPQTLEASIFGRIRMSDYTSRHSLPGTTTSRTYS